jgi:hypothetical protein
VLAAVVFAVPMTFIDQTIVSTAAPADPAGAGFDEHRHGWAINAHLLSPAALFALAGRFAETFTRQPQRSR